MHRNTYKDKKSKVSSSLLYEQRFHSQAQAVSPENTVSCDSAPAARARSSPPARAARDAVTLGPQESPALDETASFQFTYVLNNSAKRTAPSVKGTTFPESQSGNTAREMSTSCRTTTGPSCPTSALGLC